MNTIAFRRSLNAEDLHIVKTTINEQVENMAELRKAIESGELDWMCQATGSRLLSETILLAAAINTHLSH